MHLEQQLRLVQSPLYLSQKKEKAVQEQNVSGFIPTHLVYLNMYTAL